MFPEVCLDYLRSLPIPASLKRLVPALFKPLTEVIVAEALKR